MKFIKFTLFSLVFICLLTQCETNNNSIQKPNIVIIMSDDMGFSDLSCYGGEIPTPNIDNLAMNGLRFTQFYKTARCCPTRASLLTGLYSHQTKRKIYMRHMAKSLRSYMKSLKKKVEIDYPEDMHSLVIKSIQTEHYRY